MNCPSNTGDWKSGGALRITDKDHWSGRTCGSSNSPSPVGPLTRTTEFGHKPRINDNDGRDHHSKPFTCLLAGVGMECGEADGGTEVQFVELNLGGWYTHSDNFEGTRRLRTWTRR